MAAERVDRVSEGLRAGVGLGLRGDPVDVLLVDGAARWLDGGDPRIARALGTLETLGRPARGATRAEAEAAAAAARAVEVWTDGDPGRRLRLRSAAGTRALARGEVDTRALVEQIFEADGVLVW
ncbi:MAG TPA: hypothetical protein VMZ28_10015 [Kofleriaceae bacterium]|nr:hypothetical protein [Kofleriaceae bacterium]